MTGWFWAGLLTGLAANECIDVSEWAARRLVRWSAHVRYEDPERAKIRAEELVAVVASRPGQLFKLITAICFVLSAARVWMRRLAARLTDDPYALANRPARAARRGHAVAPRLLGNRVLIIVQNLPVPFDRRVWLECQALVSAGRQVAVVCPKGLGDPAYEVVGGVELYKYRPCAPGGSAVGFAAEYAYSFLATVWLTLKARRAGRFSVIQICNPPDIFWPIAVVFRAIEGTLFVFDHHELSPELFESHFPAGSKLIYMLLRALERWTHRTANHVICTNDSYRSIALTRGGRLRDNVTVVRTGPDPQRLRRGQAYPELRRGRPFLAAYIGVMGPHDGVDILLRAADIVVHQFGRDDIAFTLIGSGDCLDDLVALRDRLALGGHVEFTGRVSDELVTRILSTADVGLSPDPSNALSDLSTLNKTMEYMAFELPVIAFDLHETRVSAGDAAVYVTPNDANEYAAMIVELVNDQPKRRGMGRLGRARVEQELAWVHQERRYLDLFMHGEESPMSEDPTDELPEDRIAIALAELAAAVTDLGDWQDVRNWALAGGSELHIPAQLSRLESYRCTSIAFAADQVLSEFTDEESPDRPAIQLGIFTAQLRRSTLPAGMIANAIMQHYFRGEYPLPPTGAELRTLLLENLKTLRKILARKSVTLPCLAGGRGVRLRPGQTSLTTALGTLHSRGSVPVPKIATTAEPEIFITTTVKTQLPIVRPGSRPESDDQAAEAVQRRLAVLRLALLLGSAQAGADVPQWMRSTITGFALLVPFAGMPIWRNVTGSGDPSGRDPSPAEQTACVSAAAHLSALRLDNIQLPIDRFLLAATERATAPDVLVDAVVALDALFGSPGEVVLRVSAAVAWLLEPDSAEARTALFAEVGKIYKARSSVVHGNRSQRRQSEALVIDALKLALRVLSETFYSSQWLLGIPASLDRGLALILGNKPPHVDPATNKAETTDP